MEQEFRPHPELVNYEISRKGVVRHRRLKKPVGFVNNHGYLCFTAGGKLYLCHRAVFECYMGPIKDGCVIDHINSDIQNNSLENLQCISQSDNTRKGKTGTCKSVGKRPVQSFDTTTNEERVFHSMNAAGKYFGICMPSVQKVAEGIYQTAISKKNGHRIKFSYA